MDTIQNTAAYQDCFRLFIEQQGRNIVALERAMRSLGHAFHRRILYTRVEKEVTKPGWIDRFNWRSKLRNAECGVRNGPDPLGDPPKISPRLSASAVKANEHEATIPHSEFRTPHSQDFHTWLKHVAKNMTWDWKHQQVVIEKLKAVTEGRCKRLMIFMPPRHGKSELVTVRYSAYRMLQDPSMNIILGSYNQDLANRFSRKVRRAIADSESMRNAECGVRYEEAATGQTFPKIRKEYEQKKQHEADADVPHSALRVPQSSMFPFASSRPANRVSEWETAAGGGFRAVGVGAGVTGFGADLIVIDDPVKNRAQAESIAFRNRAYDWYTDDISTRLEPDGAMILIQTRWHEDDLAGRILRDTEEYNLEKWDVVSLPALAETGRNTTIRECVDTAHRAEEIHPQMHTDEHRSDQAVSKNISVHLCSSVDENSSSQPSSDIPHSEFRNPHSEDWRQPGEALCPERFDVESLELTKRRLGSYSFSALFQQQPSPSDGGIFKSDWFKIIPFAPAGLKWARGYDLAIATHENADYTASLRCAFDDDGNLYIADGFRDRIDFPAQRRYVLERIRAERDTIHGIEKALHGQALVSDLRHVPEIRGEALLGVNVAADKTTRALAWAPVAEEGKCYLVSRVSSPEQQNDRPQIDTDKHRSGNDQSQNTSVHLCSSVGTYSGPGWIRDFLEETAAFPVGTNDDQIDAVSIAVQLLKVPRYKAGGF